MLIEESQLRRRRSTRLMCTVEQADFADVQEYRTSARLDWDIVLVLRPHCVHFDVVSVKEHNTP